MWLILFVCLVLGGRCEPVEFSPFFDEDGFLLPEEDSVFGKFSELSFYPKGQVTTNVKGPLYKETVNAPLYTDGKATPPQETLSKLEKDYKAQLQKAANIPPSNSRPYYGTPSFYTRGSKYHQELQAASSAQSVQIQTGFVPIINGKRSHGVINSAIKDLAPPILTAASFQAQPTTFKVSASVQSTAKVQPSSQRVLNSTILQDDTSKSRPANYSRYLDFSADPQKIAISSSSSESVISRVLVKPPPNLRLQSPKIGEDTKIEAKKTLDINCEGSRDLGWCELGEKYPKKYVNRVISVCQDVIQRMYVEVPHNFEKLSDNSNFKAELNNTRRGARERGNHDAWSWASYFYDGSLCDSETGFLRPETAKDSTGKWNIIVQTESLKQRIPIEMCRKTNNSCKKMLDCGLKSQCLQKYNYHLLMSLNPLQKHDCPSMKLYRFPSACVCHVE